MKNTVYRDSQTGKFVSKSTWKHSKEQKGSRYKRQSVQTWNQRDSSGKFISKDQLQEESIGGVFEYPDEADQEPSDEGYGEPIEDVDELYDYDGEFDTIEIDGGADYGRSGE